MPVISTKFFFKDIATRAGFMDPESARKVYYAVLKTIISDVEKKGRIYLPDFGKFYMIETEEKKVPGLRGGPVITWPKIKIIKFKACDKLQNYFKKKV